MTTDEAGITISEQPRILYGDVTVHETPVPSLLENPDMLKSTFAMIANSLVEASDVVARIAAIEVELKRLQNALDVANDQAAVAIRERDAALSSRDAALRREEIANAAFETVNHQRLDAEQEAHSLRQDRQRLQDENAALGEELRAAVAKVAELEAHIARLNVDYNALKEDTDRTATVLREKARDFEDLYNVALEDTKRLEAERNDARSLADFNGTKADALAADLNRARTSLAEIRAIVG